MRFDRRYLFFALLPIAVYLLVYSVVDQARPTGIVFATIPVERFPSVAAAEGQLRYFWMSSFTVLIATALAVSASGAMALWRDTPAQDRRLVFGLVAIAGAAIVGVEISGAAQRWYTYLGEGLFLSIFPKLPTEAGWSAFDVFKVGQELVKGSAAIALLFITAGLVMTLAEPAKSMPLAQHIRHLAAASGRQRVYLQQAAMIYVLAVVVVVTWMYWPLPFLASDAVRADYSKLATGAVVLQGVMLSLGVAAIYLPAALVLRHRAITLRARFEAEETEEAKETAEGDTDAPPSPPDKPTLAALEQLQPHPFDHLRQLVTLILPALVSALPSFLSAIMA